MAKRITGVLGALALVLILTACGQGADTPETQPPTPAPGPELRYTNSLFGYTLDVPPDWAGHYAVQEFVSGVTVYNTDNGDFGGALFYIDWITAGEWHDTWREGEDAPVAVRRLAERDGLVLYAYFPSDVQFDPGDGEKAARYQAMQAERDAVLDTFALTGEAFPEIRTGCVTQADGGQLTLEHGDSCPTDGAPTVYVNGEDGMKTQLSYEDFRAGFDGYRGRTFQIFVRDGAAVLLNEIQT